MTKYKIKKEYDHHNKKEVLNKEQLVDSFLHMNHRWFEDLANGFFGYKKIFKNYCINRLNAGIFGENYNDKNLIWVEHYFEEFLGIHEIIEEEICITQM